MTRRRNRARTKDGSHKLVGDELDAAIGSLNGGAHPANALVYEPPSSALVPPAGAWAMISRRLPPMERNIDASLRPGRVFWIEREPNSDDEGFTPNGRYSAICRSPFGDVRLWPYEYLVRTSGWLVEAWQSGVLRFHPLAESERQFSNQLFYCLSRGISRTDAVVMALGSISGPVGWFEPVDADGMEAFIDMFADVGRLTETNHARRRASARRRNKETK